MTKEFLCVCERWPFYARNYNETFYWSPEAQKWYVGWIHLSDQGGFTQVSRYAIPMHYCPLCGGKLKNPEEDT